MKGSVIHTVTSPGIVGSDAMDATCFKPRCCGEEVRDESVQHLPASRQREPETMCLTHGTSLRHRI